MSLRAPSTLPNRGTQAETPEPAALRQSIREPQAAAGDLALRKLCSAQMGTRSDTQLKKKPFLGGYKNNTVYIPASRTTIA